MTPDYMVYPSWILGGCHLPLGQREVLSPDLPRGLSLQPLSESQLQAQAQIAFTTNSLLQARSTEVQREPFYQHWLDAMIDIELGVSG